MVARHFLLWSFDNQRLLVLVFGEINVRVLAITQRFVLYRSHKAQRNGPWESEKSSSFSASLKKS